MAEATAAFADEVWRRLGEHLGVEPGVGGGYTIASKGVELRIFRTAPTFVYAMKKVVATHLRISSLPISGLVGVDTSDPAKATLMFEPLLGFLERLEIVIADADYTFHGAVAA